MSINKEGKMTAELSRRNFVTGTAVAGIAAALAAGANVSTKPVLADENTKWDDEADLVIVGGGAAGLSALTTLYVENLGTGLVLEASDETQAGGNSRVCGQGVFCPKTVEAAIDYQKKCNEPYTVPDDLLQAWAENICENKDWMSENVGFEPEEMGGAEFPEFDPDGNIVWYAHQGMGPAEHTWKLFLAKCQEVGAPIYYNARATKLIKNADGEICGVTCEDGRNFKANKAVVLASGGFENNREMMDGYMEIGFPDYQLQGTPWNRGDGIRMAMSVGADLWHMNNVSGNDFEIRDSAETEEALGKVTFMTDDFIFVSGDGYRFCNEVAKARHGKVYRAGTWAGRTMPKNCYAIMGQDALDKLKTGSSGWYARTDGFNLLTTGAELLDAGIATKCDTAADIAEVIGTTEEHVQGTLDTYNGYCDAQEDLDYHREVPFDANNPAFVNTGDTTDDDKVELVRIEAPYYVVQMHGSVLNTQGGPKRGAKGEVLDTDGNPIPRLYSAGEMGCIYAYLYNLGGNFSEAISSGRLAARSASALDPIA